MIVLVDNVWTSQIGKVLRKCFQKDKQECTYISLENKTIHTCYSCEACKTDVFGLCCIQDDMQDILYQVANADVVLYIDKPSFGGYSSRMKNVWDRLAVLGKMDYMVKDKELIKCGFQTNNKRTTFHTLAVEDAMCDEEKKAFVSLLTENLFIINAQGSTQFIQANATNEEVNLRYASICNFEWKPTQG